MLPSGTFLLFMVGVVYYWGGEIRDRLWPTVRVPDHLIVREKSDHHHHICAAYEALFQVDPRYHSSPPLFYTILSIPVSREADNEALPGTRDIIVQLHRKTDSLYRIISRSPEGSQAEIRAQKQIDAWNRVGAVLLEPDIRALYDFEILKGWRDGEEVVDVLMRNEMCGGRWKEDE